MIRLSTDLQHWFSKNKVDNCMFFVGTYQALHAHTYKSEWIVNSGYIHHTIKDAYIFSSLNKDTKV